MLGSGAVMNRTVSPGAQGLVGQASMQIPRLFYCDMCSNRNTCNVDELAILYGWIRESFLEEVTAEMHFGG